MTPKGGAAVGAALKDELREHVAKQIGAIAKPKEIRFTDALPKTRSGKIMRRLLRDVAAGKEQVGDTSTLEDYSVLAKLRESELRPSQPGSALRGPQQCARRASSSGVRSPRSKVAVMPPSTV